MHRFILLTFAFIFFIITGISSVSMAGDNDPKYGVEEVAYMKTILAIMIAVLFMVFLASVVAADELYPVRVHGENDIGAGGPFISPSVVKGDYLSPAIGTDESTSGQKWTNPMRGSEPTFDPETGTRYTTPMNSWDTTKGGYVNPKRPAELLQCGTPEDPHPCRR